jgi:H2-forming N(5),N(10)-methenyltetrahydromethanopterin dehydrogenase-like protein
MKIAVLGLGTVNFHLDKLKIEEIYGGEPPYGGAAASAEFAKAGYEVRLWDENLDKFPPEWSNRLENCGVRLVVDLKDAVEGCNVVVLFTPFEEGKTFKVAAEAVPFLARNAVFATTYGIPPLILKASLEKVFLKEGRRDLGVSSLHPAALPGTPQHRQYFIATNELLREPIATEEQIQRLKKLAEDSGKKAYLIPAELVGAIADGSVTVALSVFTGLLEFYKVSRKVLHIRKPQMEFQIVQSLTTIANVITKHGMEGLIKLFNLEAIKDSLKSMYFGGDLQPMTKATLEYLNKIEEILPEGLKNSEIEKDAAYLSIPTSAMVEYVLNMVGDNMLKNLIRDAQLKFYGAFEGRGCLAEENP